MAQITVAIFVLLQISIYSYTYLSVFATVCLTIRIEILEKLMKFEKNTLSFKA